MNRTLVVWCPDWPLVAAGIPPSVAAGAFRANRVVACTAAARAGGVRRGLRRREAQGRCPELLITQHDPARDTRIFEPVIAAVEAFTPRIEVSRPGECAMGTRGPSRYFGGDEVLADAVRRAVDDVLARLPGAGDAPETRCRIGVADSPFAASLAARRSLVIPPGGSAEFLAPLPVVVLDEPELTDLLLRLGIRTLGAFAALPIMDVMSRFGPVGVTAFGRAAGEDARDLDYRVPVVDRSTQIAFEPPADRVDTAAFAAKSLADDLCTELTRTGMACRCIRIEAETEHDEQLARVWRHHRAFTPATVAERVRWQLDGWLTEHTRCGCLPGGPPCPGGPACPNPTGGTSGGLTLLRLVPEEVEPDSGTQHGFWGGATEADERAARGLARAQGLLGPYGVVTAVLGGGRSPGERVRLVPWGEPRDDPRTKPPTPARARKSKQRTSGRSAPTRVRAPTEQPAWPGRVPSPSPAVVHELPIPANVVDAAGEPVGVNGRSILSRAPTHLSVAEGPWEEITAWAGPWTTDERWWDPTARRRRARLQVVVRNGNAHLMTLEAGRWWLEASYD